MADHADIRLGDSQKSGGFPRSLLIVKGQHDHRTLALFEHLHAAGELPVVEPRHGRRVRNQIGSELRQQPLLSSRGAAQVDHGHPARAQRELGELLRLDQTTRALVFKHFQQHLLNEVIRRRR